MTEPHVASGGDDVSSRRTLAIVVILVLAILVGGVAWLRSSDDGSSGGGATGTVAPSPTGTVTAAAKVTFVELGSTTCAPCKAMVQVMADVEKAFGGQVEVVFYDVTKDSAPADQYGIQFIPTQVFLDENGVEFHRHTGFYSYGDIEALLLERGLTKVASP